MTTTESNGKDDLTAVVTDESALEGTTASTSKKEEFAKTATAAKLSGTLNIAAGIVKRKFGEYTDDPELKQAGHQQELLGKVHRLVGNFRGIKEAALKKITTTRKESQAICIKHGGRLLDVASDFVEDMKKAILK